MKHDPMCPTINANVRDHLPECIYTPEQFDPEQNIVWGGRPCICDALRACEQRVREDGLYVSGVNVGYESGLAKAQEAVEAHRVRGYRCSCGAEVNSINGHLSSIITGLREGAK